MYVSLSVDFLKYFSLCLTSCHQKCKGVRAVFGFMDESVHISIFECLCVHACVFAWTSAFFRFPAVSFYGRCISLHFQIRLKKLSKMITVIIIHHAAIRILH